MSSKCENIRKVFCYYQIYCKDVTTEIYYSVTYLISIAKLMQYFTKIIYYFYLSRKYMKIFVISRKMPKDYYKNLLQIRWKIFVIVRNFIKMSKISFAADPPLHLKLLVIFIHFQIVFFYPLLSRLDMFFPIFRRWRTRMKANAQR